jgi:hypothetical protein
MSIRSVGLLLFVYISLTCLAWVYDREKTILPVEVTVIHALIHSGGIPGKESRGFVDKYVLGVPAHDLTYLGQKYRDIIKNCTLFGSKALGG